MSLYINNITIAVPADAMGKSINEKVVRDIVEAALQAPPFVTARDLMASALDVVHYEDTAKQYDMAVRLAGIAMRRAWENR